MSGNVEITPGEDKSFHMVGGRKKYKVLITQYPVTDVYGLFFYGIANV